ncbi:hypothetical protein RFI_35885, partial [Reticulomyxa filosa]
LDSWDVNAKDGSIGEKVLFDVSYGRGYFACRKLISNAVDRYSYPKYCFDMFYQGNQVATGSQFQSRNDDEIWDKLDPDMENGTKNIIDEKKETNIMNDISGAKIQDIWEKYFNGDSIAKYVLRR